MTTKNLGLTLTFGLLLTACGGGRPNATEPAATGPTVSAASTLPSGTVACFYEHINYQGASFCASADTSWVGSSWNDRISSVKVQNGQSVQLFSDINYGGRLLTLTGDNADLRGNSFNDVVSSFKVGAPTLPAPPASIVDNIRPGGPVVRRVYYDDQIAVYFGDGMDPSVHWMNDYIKQAWIYIKQTYGSFGPDSRIYVVAHKNSSYNYATVNTRFDSGFGYRNVIDLGGAWDWSNPQQLNYEVITHELSHIIEGGSKDTKESPSFEVWRDGPWPEISVYDIYRGIGKTDWAQNWYNRMIVNRNGSYSSDLPGSYYTFRDWFYPIYSQYGGSAVLNKYFTLLSQCFPKRDISVGGQPAKEYARRANVGEFVHFWSGAAGVNLKAQFTKAYTWNSTIESQFRQAQNTFSCAHTYTY